MAKEEENQPCYLEKGSSRKNRMNPTKFSGAAPLARTGESRQVDGVIRIFIKFPSAHPLSPFQPAIPEEDGAVALYLMFLFHIPCFGCFISPHRASVFLRG